jgi:large subunit ribosomal protein L22
MRLVVDLIRGKNALHALDLLSVTPKRATGPLAKLLASAIANAKVKGMNVDTLTISEIRVDGGAVLKRMIPGSRGSGFPIKKRTSHVIITLDEAKKKIEAPASAKATAGKPKNK